MLKLPAVWIAQLEVRPGADPEYFPPGILGGFVNVAVCANSRETAIAEIDVYMGCLMEIVEVQSFDLLQESPGLLQDPIVSELVEKLDGRRKVAWGSIFSFSHE